MDNKALQEISNEFQIEFQQFLLKNAALIQNSILRRTQNDNSNSISMNTSVGGPNSFQNSVDTPPPPLTQPAPQPQHQEVFFPNNIGAGGMSMFDGESAGAVGVVGNNLDFDSSNIMFENYQDTFVSEDEEEVSAQDFVKFIGQLDNAIDHQDDHQASHTEEKNKGFVDQYPSFVFGMNDVIDLDHHVTDIEEMDTNKDCDNLSFIFGNPIHDVQMNSTNSAVPIPAAYDLNNNRARVA